MLESPTQKNVPFDFDIIQRLKEMCMTKLIAYLFMQYKEYSKVRFLDLSG